MPSKETGYVIESTSSKIVIFLLVINLFTTLAVGYTVYTNVSQEYNISVETPPQDKEFQENMYNGLSMLMAGQSQLVVNQQDLNVGTLRVHHYVEPHADQFYENCPECKLERQQILEEEKESVTSDTEGL